MQRSAPFTPRAIRTLAAALAAALIAMTAIAAAAATFDLSPEQRGRPRGTADAAVERAV
ncbi:ABC transporter substrate-binding protein, partial [Burkholderia territorii]